MNTVSLQDFQGDPLAILARVEAGEHFVVVRGDEALAEFRPIHRDRAAPRPFGLAAGAFAVPNDFDEPLPEDFLRAFEGR